MFIDWNGNELIDPSDIAISIAIMEDEEILDNNEETEDDIS